MNCQLKKFIIILLMRLTILLIIFLVLICLCCVIARVNMPQVGLLIIGLTFFYVSYIIWTRLHVQEIMPFIAPELIEWIYRSLGLIQENGLHELTPINNRPTISSGNPTIINIPLADILQSPLIADIIHPPESIISAQSTAVSTPNNSIHEALITRLNDYLFISRRVRSTSSSESGTLTNTSLRNITTQLQESIISQSPTLREELANASLRIITESQESLANQSPTLIVLNNVQLHSIHETIIARLHERWLYDPYTYRNRTTISDINRQIINIQSINFNQSEGNTNNHHTRFILHNRSWSIIAVIYISFTVGLVAIIKLMTVISTP